MTKKQLKELKNIQKECERYYNPKVINKEGIIQNIWKTVNFMIMKEENKK